jgi:transcriptional regulator with XRE-family HTH domain
MTRGSHSLGPRNAAEERIYAEVELLMDVQFALLDMQRSAGVSPEELAEKLGWTQRRLAELLTGSQGGSFGLTIEAAARIAHALGGRLKVTVEHEQTKGRD